MSRLLNRLFLIALAILLSGGMTACEWLRPYRIDVRQGTVVTGEMVAQLKPGMTADQVRFVLGSPLLIDPFHAERWDYPNEFRAGRSSVVERKLFTVFFKDGKLARWEGDVQPTPPGAEDDSKNRVIDIAPAK